MTNAQAILAGAALIAGAILLVETISPAAAQRFGGPYQLMHHSNPSANAGVFRIDQSSGEVSYCYVTGNSELICSRPVR